MRRYLVPLIGLTGVATLAAVLILLVVLRAVPGMGMIFSPDTHANLWEEARPAYNRTALAPVAQQGETAGHLRPTSGALSQELSQRDQGQRLFASVGCAMCHGLEGQGSIIAPAVAGASPQVVEAMVRFGPGGMLAFSEDQLSAGELEKIITYLQSLEPRTEVTWVSATPTPRPQPTTAITPAVPEDGKRLFSSVGCAACHGAEAGGGVGPPLAGVTAEHVRAMVRSGRGVMPAFSLDTLSEEKLAAIIEYLQSLGAPEPQGHDH